MFAADEEQMIERKAEYCQRVDRILQEYDCTNRNLSDPIDEGYLNFIGFGKQNKRKRIRSRSNQREVGGNVGWVLQTFKSILGF